MTTTLPRAADLSTGRFVLVCFGALMSIAVVGSFITNLFLFS